MNDPSTPESVDTGFRVWDVPVNPDDPNCSTFTSRRVYRTDEDAAEPDHVPPLGARCN